MAVNLLSCIIIYKKLVLVKKLIICNYTNFVINFDSYLIFHLIKYLLLMLVKFKYSYIWLREINLKEWGGLKLFKCKIIYYVVRLSIEQVILWTYGWNCGMGVY